MLSIGAALILLLSHVLSAQPKRKPTGSLEGVWSYATLTPFERPEGFGELFTDAQAAEFEAQTIGRNDAIGATAARRPTRRAASPTTGSIAASTSGRSTARSARRGSSIRRTARSLR